MNKNKTEECHIEQPKMKKNKNKYAHTLKKKASGISTYYTNSIRQMRLRKANKARQKIRFTVTQNTAMHVANY